MQGTEDSPGEHVLTTEHLEGGCTRLQQLEVLALGREPRARVARANLCPSGSKPSRGCPRDAPHSLTLHSFIPQLTRQGVCSYAKCLYVETWRHQSP